MRLSATSTLAYEVVAAYCRELEREKQFLKCRARRLITSLET